MRDLKFRYWDKESKSYVYSDSFDFDTNEKKLEAFFRKANLYSDREYEQFVGIKDSQGINIYEGDIIKNETSYEEYCSPAVVYTSVYEEIGYAFFMKFKKIESHHIQLLKNFNGVDLYEEFPLSYFNIRNYTIIGNIHQNMDLFNNL